MAAILLILLAAWLAHEVQADGISNSSLDPNSEAVSSSTSQQFTSDSTCGNVPHFCEEDSMCPLGLFCVDGHCECGKSYPHNLIRCEDATPLILRRFCATFDTETNLTSVGNCFQGDLGEKENSTTDIIKLYRELPRNASESWCKPLNRMGKLCGKCFQDHYPLTYSYNVSCMNCSKVGLNWLTYIVVAYIPLTLFFIVILFFKINTTSSTLFAVVYYCQLITKPFAVKELLYVVHRDNDERPYVSEIANILVSVYGIWNLDFFRPYYSSICLQVEILPNLALDYAIAFYPLFLIVCSYLLVLLYNQNYTIVVTMWSPFRYMFTFIRRNWDIKTSLLDAYATFFFLSNMKLLGVCFHFLIPVRVYHLYRNSSNYTLSVYHASHLKYFGNDHLPYAITAIVILLLFFILPMVLLALYPFKCFHRLLNCFPTNWYILHTFMDSMQGSYKDGTEPGTRDCRWFVSVFFMLRFVDYILYAISDFFVSLVLQAMLAIILTTAIATIQPFKSPLNNKINIAFLNVLILFSVSVIALNSLTYLAPEYTTFFYILTCFFGTVPLIYTLAIIVHWVHTNNVLGVGKIKKWKIWRMKSSRLADLNNSLPDRITNSGDYPRQNLAYLPFNSVSEC